MVAEAVEQAFFFNRNSCNHNTININNYLKLEKQVFCHVKRKRKHVTIPALEYKNSQTHTHMSHNESERNTANIYISNRKMYPCKNKATKNDFLSLNIWHFQYNKNKRMKRRGSNHFFLIILVHGKFFFRAGVLEVYFQRSVCAYNAQLFFGGKKVFFLLLQLTQSWQLLKMLGKKAITNFISRINIYVKIHIPTILCFSKMVKIHRETKMKFRIH